MENIEKNALERYNELHPDNQLTPKQFSDKIDDALDKIIDAVEEYYTIDED